MAAKDYSLHAHGTCVVIDGAHAYDFGLASVLSSVIFDV